MKFIFGHEETINMIHELLTWRQPTLLGRPSQQSVILKKIYTELSNSSRN